MIPYQMHPFMKKRTLIKLGISLFLALGTAFAYAYAAKNEQASPLIRPTPENENQVYEAFLNSQMNSYDPEPNWLPKVTEKTNKGAPDIIGTSAILVDMGSGQTLFEKDATKIMPIASLTKIMTAVIALEHKNLNDNIVVSKKCQNVGENAMSINEGEIYTLNDLMHGLILNSGNDAACTIAEGTAGNTDTFVKWMNIKAQELGLKNTQYFDPSGLDDRTYSTPQDLAKLTRYALKNPEFRQIVGTLEYEIPSSKNNTYHYLYNQTNLLSTYPGVAGVKTGYTEKAGLCLVTYANNEGKEVLGVVLNSSDRKGDMILMLDYGYNELGINVQHNLLNY